MKKIFSLFIVMLVMTFLASCEQTSNEYFDSGSSGKDTMDVEFLQFTLSELSQYNGKDGMKAYVTVDNKIYDVSDVWESGEHNGYSAGTDISDFIDSAPHGDSVLQNLDYIGNIISD